MSDFSNFDKSIHYTISKIKKLLAKSGLLNINPMHPNIQLQKRLLPNGEAFFLTSLAETKVFVTVEITE